MAKVDGPLFSLGATGTLKKTIVYQGRPSGTAVFGRKVPYDPKSTAQVGMREHMASGVDYWKKLSEVYQTQWNDFVD